MTILLAISGAPRDILKHDLGVEDIAIHQKNAKK